MKMLGPAFASFAVIAMMAGAYAKEETLTLRITSDDGRIQFSHHGKRLTDATMERLCAEARSHKVEIEFQREKMTRDDALASILKEAQCLGATHSGATKVERETKSAAHRHAKPRHRGAEPR